MNKFICTLSTNRTNPKLIDTDTHKFITLTFSNQQDKLAQAWRVFLGKLIQQYDLTKTTITISVAAKLDKETEHTIRLKGNTASWAVQSITE